MTQRETLKLKRRIPRTILLYRVDCLGMCGTKVLRGQGECRNCKRARIRAGQKRLRKARV